MMELKKQHYFKHLSNNEIRQINKRMLKQVDKSLKMNGMFTHLKYLPTNIYFKEKKNNFAEEKLGRNHINQWFKLVLCTTP